jgi:trigger factor
LGEVLLGAMAGQVRTLEITLDDKFPKEEYRGKKVSAELKINEVKRIRLPELADQLAQAAGYKTLADMKDAVRAGVKRAKENLAQEILRSALADALLSKVDFELPQDIAESMSQDIQRRRELYLKYRGVPQEEIEKAQQDLSTRSREEAVRSLKLYLIYEHIADKEKIFATEEDVERRIEALAQARQVTPARLREYIQQQNLLAQLRSQIREEKTVEFLLNEAKLEEGSQPESEAATPPESEAATPPESESAKQ